jgi:hypothetical protein
VDQDNNGNLVIKEEALKIIQNLKGDVAVCIVVGPLRTGKSFILNLLLNQNNGFKLGGDISSCTRGIWMWNTPIKHRNQHGEFNLILMDTEGLGSSDRAPEHDNQIFVLSLLLSSYFVFNTKNAIDRDAIKKLGIMGDLSKFINSNIGENQENSVASNSPDFIWCLRDVFLNLRDKTPKQYLQECLEMRNIGGTNSKEIEEVNLIRDAIKNSFNSLNCYILPRPIDNGFKGMSLDETLQKLDTVDIGQLQPNFLNNVDHLWNTMKSNIRPKNYLFSGSAFSEYIKIVVEKLNKNEKVSVTESLTLSIKYASERGESKKKMIYAGIAGAAGVVGVAGVAVRVASIGPQIVVAGAAAAAAAAVEVVAATVSKIKI